MNKYIRAFQFNQSLGIPVKWKRARIVRGVSKRGGGPIESGNGHILLLEDWEGHKKGEFLCGANIPNQLAHEHFNVNEFGIEGSKYERVTCRRCLKALERMKKTGAA